MSTLSRAPTGNNLIDSFPPKTRARVIANCDTVELAFGKSIEFSGERTRHVFFPIQGFISLITPVHSAPALEVGLVGNEGMHGISLALGVDVSPLRSIVQGSGSALRMSAAAFKREHLQSLEFRQQLNRYLYVLMSQLAQSAACTRYHQVDARLARWLLMTSDRAHSDEFHITQTFLAWMLGVRRASVTVAALALQKRGLITYKRGAVIVLNRRGLETCACCCYQNDKDVYQRIIGLKKRPSAKSEAARRPTASPAG